MSVCGGGAGGNALVPASPGFFGIGGTGAAGIGRACFGGGGGGHPFKYIIKIYFGDDIEKG